MSKKEVQPCMKLIEELKSVWPDFEITVDELLSPTSNSALKFYERLVLGLQIDLPRISQELIADTAERDLYSEIASSFAVFLGAKHIFQYLSEYQSLDLHDVLAPTAIKFRNNVKMVINFYFYSNKSSERIESILLRVYEDAHNVAQHRNTVNELKKQLHELTLENAANLAICVTVEDQTQELRLPILEHEQQLEVLAERERAIEKKYAVAKNQQKHLIIQLEQKLQRRNELKSQIVENPETIILEEKTLEDQIEQAKSEENTCALQLSNKSTLAAYFKKIIEKHHHITNPNNMRDFLSHFERNTNIRKSIEEAEQQHKDQLELQKVKSIANATVDRDIAELEKQLQSCQLKHATRKTDLLKEIKNLETEFQTVSDKKSKCIKEEYQLDKKIEARKEKLAECSSEMAETLEFTNQQSNLILEAYGLLETCANHNLNEIVALLKMRKAK